MCLSLKLIFFMVVPIFHQIGVHSDKIIDLTWKFGNETIYWSGVKPFRYTKQEFTMQAGYWYTAKEFEAGEHGGTHLDAPYHFNKNGWKVDEIPPELLFVNAVLLDFSKEVATAGPDYVVDPEVLKSKLKNIEPIPNNSVLLLKYGWSKYWPDKKKYLRKDDQGVFHFPGLNNASSKIIVGCKKFVGIAVDVASGDVGNSQTYPAHQILLGSNMYILENTRIEEHLPEKEFRLIVAPMKLAGGTGAPARILALLNTK